ncbi:MAG: hypothetical protein GVY36_09910 [Verrucomicrobia bacterium]|jgi:hypothetical protein|nr:hypothetical protein [Verrucomicrobiota bacterium]
MPDDVSANPNSPKSFIRAALGLLIFSAWPLVFASTLSGHERMELGEPYWAESVEDDKVAKAKTHAMVAGQSSEPVLYDHGDPTDYEQLMLERVNRARGDPGAEAARLGIDLNEGLAPGTITDTPKQPIAPNCFLTAAARGHSDWMLSVDTFSHTGENGSTASERMSDAGYVLSGTWTTGENCAWSGTTGSVDLLEVTIQMHEGLFKSPGHRTNICDGDFEELGIGIREGLFYSQGTDYDAGMTTQNFVRSSATPGPFVTGVVYEDANENGLYDVGEGIQGVEVGVSGSSYYGETSASGGYAVPLTSYSATVDVTFTGDDWEEIQNVALEPDTNLKVDLVLDAASVWYDHASSIEPDGWRYFDWFKGFKPKDGTNWIYHGRHGWLFVLADDTSGMFLWDVALGHWLFTNETVYPWMYAYGPDEGWIFFFEGGRPGSRFFQRGDTGAVLSGSAFGASR